MSSTLGERTLTYLKSFRSCLDLDSGWTLMDRGQSMSDCHVICHFDEEWPRTFIASLEYNSNLALREFAPVDSIEFASKNIHAIYLDCWPFSKSNRCRLIKMQSYKIWGHLIHCSSIHFTRQLIYLDRKSDR